MARSMERQTVGVRMTRRTIRRIVQDFEDSWPEEPTSVDAAMTMEEMMLDELRRHTSMTPSSHSSEAAKKGTPTR